MTGRQLGMRLNGVGIVAGVTAVMAAAVLAACAAVPTPAAAPALVGAGGDDRGQQAAYVVTWHALAEHPDSRLLLSTRVWSSRSGAVAAACGSFTVTFFSADGRVQIESANACTDDSGWATVSLAQPADGLGHIVAVPWSANGVISGLALPPLQGTSGP